MSRTITPTTRVTLAALALAAASAGCGIDAQSHAARTAAPPSVTAEQAIARRLDGLYTAHIPRSALSGALPRVHVPAGTWALRVDVGGRALRLTPPDGGDITLRIAGVAASRLRIAPDTACESRAGRTVPSRFTWSKAGAFLRLQTVRAPCRSDATVLTVTSWRAAWPTPGTEGFLAP